MTPNTQHVEQLLSKVALDPSAGIQLLLEHQARLREMVRRTLDARLRPRVAPSDVVQEVLLEAAKKLKGYAQDRPLPFFTWLCGIARQHVSKAERKHLRTGKRSVAREQNLDSSPDGLVDVLAKRLVSTNGSPSHLASVKERRTRVRAALDSIRPRYRELLEMRYLQQFTMRQIASEMGVSEGAAKVCHMRALKALSQSLGAKFLGELE